MRGGVELGGGGAILQGAPMQNRHFYSCARDVFAIGFRKSGDFARDILTIFEKASYNVLLHEKSVIFSFDNPSRPKWPLFFRKSGFSRSPEIREVADLRQGSSFLAFFIFFLLEIRAL